MRIGKWKISTRKVVKGVWAGFIVFTVVMTLVGTFVLGLGNLR